MRGISLIVLFLVPSFSPGQTKEIQESIQERLLALKYVESLHDAASGGFRPDLKGKPSLRATSAAVRAWKYLEGPRFGAKFPDRARAAEFVMQCYDPKAGGFADAPGLAPDYFSTAVGIMAAVEFGIPREKFAKAMDYLRDKHKSFEDLRIGAAAIEAWGVKDCPFNLDTWFEAAKTLSTSASPPAGEDPARMVGGLAAMVLRLGKPLNNRDRLLEILESGQRPDGGWGKGDAKASDLESTYRVMRAYYLFTKQPKNSVRLRDFLARCRNKDGGSGINTEKPSNMSGVYFAAVVGHWLDELEKK